MKRQKFLEQTSKPSPFSILRSTTSGNPSSLDEELKRSNDYGHTRATFLKHLHLRKKIEENPLLRK
jgi:hypothetical protein